jgi:predicted transcriptional regulator
MATVAEWYRITYIDTHLQRFNDAQRLVQADIQQQFLVAQLLNEQIKNLDKQIQDINDAQSKGQFDRLVKAYGLEQQVISDTQRRQLSVISTVDDMYRIDSSLASIGTAADSFGNALSTAGSIEGKVGRFARTVGGYTRGSEQAKAVAATIYDQFKAAANARGASFAAQFNTNDAKIRKEIAQATGVTPTDISTVNQQKEAKLNEMLQDQGQQAISNKEIKEAIVTGKLCCE